MKNWKKIFTIGLFVICITLGFALSAFAEDSTIYDISNGIYSEQYSYSQMMECRDEDNNHTAPTATKSDYIFAGWYSAKECGKETALTDEDIDVINAEDNKETKYYAKFVSKDVLSVKTQLRADTDSTTESTTLRFVTTVDCLDYMEVGFTLVLNGETYSVSSQEVYRYLYYVGTTGGDAMPCYPNEFHEASEYFMACNLNKIPTDYFELSAIATPYWVTCDGTRVEGAVSEKTVKEGMPLVCETKVINTTGEVYYYTTLEKAFLVADSGDKNEYLEDRCTVEIIQDTVEIESTLAVYDNVTLRNEDERDVTITRNMSGSVFVDNLSTGLTIKGVTTTVGEENKGSLTFVGEETSNTRGCIDSDGTGNILALNNITIQNFNTQRDGGVIRTTGTAEITDCVFKNIIQTGDTGGGVIYHISGKLTATSCTFQGNQATAGSGAAIYVKAGELIVDSCDFDTNKATAGNGGAICVKEGTVTIQNDCSFTNNTAKHGGAVRFDATTTEVTIEDSFFKGNYTGETQKYNGGAINLQAMTGAVVIKNTVFEDNEVAYCGGAIYTAATNITVDGCTFDNNTLSSSRKDGSGAGVYNAASSEISLTNITLIDQETADFVNVSVFTQTTASVANSGVKNILDYDDSYQMSLLKE